MHALKTIHRAACQFALRRLAVRYCDSAPTRNRPYSAQRLLPTLTAANVQHEVVVPLAPIRSGVNSLFEKLPLDCRSPAREIGSVDARRAIIVEN